MNNEIAPDVPNKDFRNIAQVVIWAIKTIVMAKLTPYVAVGLCFALMAIAGASIEVVRENTVMMATLNDDSWYAAASTWRTFTISCYLLVVAVRIYASSPVQALSESVGERIEAWIKRKFACLETRVVKGVPLMLFFIAIFVAGGIFFVVNKNNRVHPDLSDQKFSLAAPAYKPQATAAIRLLNGSIKSGGATVSEESEGRYVVVFNK